MSAWGQQCRAWCHFWSCTADRAAAPLWPVALGSPLQTLLEGHLGDNQSLRSSAFRWGTENCKEIWQGSRSTPNKGLATWRNICKAALRAECFQQRQLTKIHFTTGTKFLLFQHLPTIGDTHSALLEGCTGLGLSIKQILQTSSIELKPTVPPYLSHLELQKRYWSEERETGCREQPQTAQLKRELLPQVNLQGHFSPKEQPPGLAVVTAQFNIREDTWHTLSFRTNSDKFPFT